jgi:D-alanyl-D-alanine carboxypeptidase/D-alanyl-D-alanine-endopeptidase (penicillin-binding protein 4)
MLQLRDVGREAVGPCVEVSANSLVEEGQIIRHCDVIIERRTAPSYGPSSPFSGSAGPIRRAAAVLVAAVVSLLFADAAAGSLGTRLSKALASSGISWTNTGAIVQSATTGKILYARGSKLSLRPASNEKLAVTVAALDRLRPDWRFPTAVIGRGERVGAAWSGDVFLKGYGDPTLQSEDLRRLAKKLYEAGIRRVSGGVVGDESYYDTLRTAPGWKASFYKEECPPLSALIVDRGEVGGRTVTYPARIAARAFRAALVAAGIRVAGKARLGVAPAGGQTLATTRSPKLAFVVKRMNRRSDNFYAEMLLKQLGAVQRNKGTTGAGAIVVRNVLRERKVPLSGVRVVDGSGLSRGDRLTGRAVAAILRSAFGDDAIRGAFYASLPRAGLEGTLRDRMRKPPARGLVRGKTGTTNNASALSGFVGTTYVFSVLQNGSPVPYTAARSSQDRFAQILAARVA